MKPLDELTAHCIRCGFCLESCPTYLVTGEETESPRGRIYLVRSADEGKLDWEDVRPHLNRCLGCRACETACPSGVEYGQIFEIARDRLESKKTHLTKKALLGTLTDPRKARLQMALGRMLPGKKIPVLLSKLLSGESPEANKPAAQPAGTLPGLSESSHPLPPPSVSAASASHQPAGAVKPRDGVLPPIRGEVYLLQGCVMRVLFPRVHEATRRLLRRVGYVVRDVEQGCCGSLHLHAGYMDEARERAQKLVSQFDQDLPVIVNSAGCGSTMKGYGELLNPQSSTPNPLSVFDASEFLLANGLVEALNKAPGLDITATYHDACHLAHGQRIKSQPRQLLDAVPRLNMVELSESDTCCGSAGIYNLTQPKLGRELLERKWKNIGATGASVVAMGNPGCHAWIGQAAQEHGSQVKVLHTMELLEAAFIGIEHFE
jgi:glycolate oxidase iron-sulfur subunit